MVRARDLALALALSILSLAVYGRTLAPSILPGDSGEFQFAAPLLAVAHPTGYPFYLILGWIASVALPIGDAAFRINLLSALLSAATVGVVYLAAMELGAKRLPSAAAALVLAFSLTFWSQATRAEVYALNSLLVAVESLLVLRILASDGPARPRASWPTLLLAAFVLGLGLAHHRTIILLAPAILAALWIGRRALPRFSGRRVAALAAAVAAPSALYLYIPLRAPQTPYFRLPVTESSTLVLYDGSLQAFLREISGSGFGSLFSLDRLDLRLLSAGGLLLAQFTVAGLALAVIGLAWLLPRSPARWVYLVAGFLSFGAFCLIYRIGDIGDLYTPSYLFTALALACGIQALADAPNRSRRRAVTLGARAIAIVAFLLPLTLAVTNLASADRSGDATRATWEAVLAQPVPPGSILVSNDRDEIMPMWYLQYAEGQHRDLLGLFPLISDDRAYGNVVRVVETALDTSRPVYLVKDMPGLAVRYDYEPEGTLYRVQAMVDLGVVQTPARTDMGGLAIFQGVQVVGVTECSCGAIAGAPKSQGAFTVTLYWEGAGAGRPDLQSFVHVLDANGVKVAQSDHRPGGEYYPSSLWQPGEAIRDVHRMAAPAPGTYELAAGLYRSDNLERVGDVVRLGPVTF